MVIHRCRSIRSFVLYRDLDLGGQGQDGIPSWIIGDTFLKNVYSVFRFSDPPAVGFASKGSGGTSLSVLLLFIILFYFSDSLSFSPSITRSNRWKLAEEPLEPT